MKKKSDGFLLNNLDERNTIPVELRIQKLLLKISWIPANCTPKQCISVNDSQEWKGFERHTNFPFRQWPFQRINFTGGLWWPMIKSIERFHMPVYSYFYVRMYCNGRLTNASHPSQTTINRYFPLLERKLKNGSFFLQLLD